MGGAALGGLAGAGVGSGSFKKTENYFNTAQGSPSSASQKIRGAGAIVGGSVGAAAGTAAGLVVGAGALTVGGASAAKGAAHRVVQSYYEARAK